MIRNELRRNPLASLPRLDEGYWLRRAKLTYDKAAMAQDPNLQQRLQRVAFEYERLAGVARETAGRPSGIGLADKRLLRPIGAHPAPEDS